MRKFKLIKQFPGSDSLGTIVTGSKETMYSKGLGFRNYDWSHVEIHPEYWEEIVEKDFEILIKRVTPSEILSVKRLSDGEVFTIGDEFKANIGGKEVTRTIKGIIVEEDELTIYHQYGSLSNDRIEGIFNSIKKLKHPLFLTHDGNNIYEGDKVWYVNKESFYHDYILTFPQTKFCSDINAYFLTREEAEEYIIEKYIFLKQAVKQRLNLK